MKKSVVILAVLLLVVAVLFGVSRQTVSGQNATATPAEEATEAPTEEATEEATEEPTEEAMEEATDAPDEEATDEPEEEATAEPEEEASATPEEEAQAVMTLPDTVRQSTEAFQDVQAALDAGYGLFHGCVSSPNGGAMGIHYANGDLVGDGEIASESPEALIYEPREGALHLVGVEYVVLAEAWDANNDVPPVLMGQLFNYNSAPNRYGLPAFYELHVWAWKDNPDGVFADWNPDVSCEEYTGDTSMAAMSH